MKILVDLKSLESIDRYQADGFIISSEKYSCYNDYCFSWSVIEEIANYCHQKNILFIVNIDRIIEEEELDSLYQYLDQCLRIGVDYFIYSDFAILNYFKKKNLTNKLIYDSKTMITNSQDAIIHKNLKSLVVISNELNLEELSEVVKVGNGILEVYGFHQMFYSKRPLLSTYSAFQAKGRVLDNKKLLIKEELRDDLYPIYQSLHGTYIYTPYVYCIFKELLKLKDNLKMIRINSMFIEENKIIQILTIFRQLLNNENDIDFLYKQLETINPNIRPGLLYNQSILKKETEQ